jgi:hypothetical protein
MSTFKRHNVKYTTATMNVSNESCQHIFFHQQRERVGFVKVTTRGTSAPPAKR